MTKRQYDQYCPLACALDVIGERWALLVVRELLSGPKRFVDLETGLPGIGTNTLTTRLDELEEAGVLAKRRLPAPAASAVYELTSWGRDLGPILAATARWGVRRLAAASPRHPLRASWLAAALQAFFRGNAVRGLTAVVELVFPTGTLHLHFRRGRLTVTEGAAGGSPAMRIVGTEQRFLDLLRGRARKNARGGRGLRIEGDRSLLDRLIAAFPIGAEGTA
jgi:DNA-binding HxlR family transcriptional regulator